MPLTLQSLYNNTKYTVYVTNQEYPHENFTISPGGTGTIRQGLAYEEAKAIIVDINLTGKKLRLLTMWDRGGSNWGMSYRIGSSKDASVLRGVNSDGSKDFYVNLFNHTVDLNTIDGQQWTDGHSSVVNPNWLEAILDQQECYISDGSSRFLAVDEKLPEDPEAYLVRGRSSLSTSVCKFKLTNTAILASDPYMSLLNEHVGRHVSRGKTKVHLPSYSSDLVEVERLVVANPSATPDTSFLLNFHMDGSMKFQLGHSHKRKGDHTDHAYAFSKDPTFYVYPENEKMAKAIEDMNWGGDIYEISWAV